MTTDPLIQLRPIHTPVPPGLWPWAPGWWILLGVLLVLISIGAMVRYRNRQRRYLKNAAINKLYHLKQRHAAGDSGTEIVAELSILLRRAALAYYPRKEVAHLHGEAWLEWLSKTSRTTQFTEYPGRLLIEAPYQNKPVASLTTLFDIAEEWLKASVKRKQFSQIIYLR